MKFTQVLALASMALGVMANSCVEAPEWCGSSVEAKAAGRTSGWGCKIDGDRPCDTECVVDGSRGSGPSFEYMMCCKPCPTNIQ
ncbi:hypothetical protein BUE80_DR003509 [Diplocarpon rosae]|nr:hypothetical protein BUE80_DR003509 [Diplocarpon rosae]